jgi:hypothetical protein
MLLEGMTFRRTSLARSLSIALAGATLCLLVACGGSSSTPDTPDGSGATAQPQTSECTKPLETFICSSRSTGWCCPASYDGSAATLPACSGLGERQSHGTCNGTRIVVRNFGTHAIECYYSAATSALVGAEMQDDIPDFCGSASAQQSGGEVPAGCTRDALTPTENCPPRPDAGADAG